MLYTTGRTWEQLLWFKPDGEFWRWGHIVFSIFDPNGLFFLRDAFRDDLRWNDQTHTTESQLQPMQLIYPQIKKFIYPLVNLFTFYGSASFLIL